VAALKWQRAVVLTRDHRTGENVGSFLLCMAFIKDDTSADQCTGKSSSLKPGLQVIDAPGWRLDRTWHQCVEQPLFVDGEAAVPRRHNGQVASFCAQCSYVHVPLVALRAKQITANATFI
jgi:hypothetical protein